MTATDAPGKPITIGFSAPEADHGWIGAITANAKSQAGRYSEVTLDAVEGTNDVNQQISQVQTLIDKKVDVIVLLPFDGKALTETGLKAQLAGIRSSTSTVSSPTRAPPVCGSAATTMAWVLPPAPTSPPR